ncbi:ABC transporter permease [Candidatus Saccharibacteria bacterium]|nr:ABC transporter permease [Candidatus Saccharibacteria bacterium]
MLRTVFGKTLFEKRWMILIWTLAVFVTNLALVQIFPPMKEALSEMMTDLPESLAALFGNDSQALTSLKGYVSLEVFGQMSLAVVVFGIVFSSSVLAGEEKSGLLLTQLARPVSRVSFFIQKYLAYAAALVLVMVGFVLGTSLGTLMLGEVITPCELANGAVGITLLALGLGSLTFAIGAIFANGALAGALVGFYAVLGYFIASMSGAADILTTLGQLTPFHYYNEPDLMYNSFDIKNVLVLLGIVIVPLIAALPVFARRDLRTR